MSTRDVALGIWAALGAVFVVGQMVAVLSRGHVGGLGRLLEAVMAGRIGRGLVVLGWMWLGWHAFAR